MSRIHLATQHPIRMGALSGVNQYFKGRVTCLQIYGMMLNSNQIATIKKKCAARDRKWLHAYVISMQAVCVTIISRARIGYEMVDSQRGK